MVEKFEIYFKGHLRADGSGGSAYLVNRTDSPEPPFIKEWNWSTISLYRAYLYALLGALKTIPPHSKVDIYTDNNVCITVFQGRWIDFIKNNPNSAVTNGKKNKFLIAAIAERMKDLQVSVEYRANVDSNIAYLKKKILTSPNNKYFDDTQYQAEDKTLVVVPTLFDT